MGGRSVGDLAGILQFIGPKKNTTQSGSKRCQFPLVAGARNHSSLRSEKVELKQLLKDIKWCMSMPDFWYLCHA